MNFSFNFKGNLQTMLARRGFHMRRTIMLLGIAAGLALTVGASPLAAQSCRAQCDEALAQCKQSCANAQNPDECKANCQGFYQQCLASCQ